MDAIIKNSNGEVLDYSFADGLGSRRSKDWLVVLGHGVTGNKDRPVIVDTAAALNEIGFDTLRFSFSGNGDSGGRFEDATIRKEVGDLLAVLSVAKKSYSRICYIGHSMGAAVGVIVAAENAEIDCLVSLAGMVDTAAFAKEEFGALKPGTDFMWEDESCPLSAAFMEDLCHGIGSVMSYAEKVEQPWLLLHGTADDVVLIKDTEAVARLKGDRVTTVVIKDADHSFGEADVKRLLLSRVTEWLRKTLR